MFKTIRLLLVSITVAIAVNSCSKDPTSSNSKINLLGQDIISTAVFDSNPANINQRASTYDFMLKSGFATQIILGKSSYGESDALMRFDLTLSDSLLNHLFAG